MSKSKLRLHFNIDELTELLKSFYTLTQIRIIVFDDEFQKIIAYPPEHTGFCRVLRKDIAARATCRISDLNGCKACKKHKSVYFYECHAGLMEVVVPLINQNIITGYLMLGQVLISDDKTFDEVWASLMPKISQYSVNHMELKEALRGNPVRSKENILAAAKILESCASHLYLTQMISVKNEDLSIRISSYIEQHLHENISVEELCEHFQVNRTKLYEIFNHSLGMGISQYIRNLRIRKASDQLVHSSLKISEIAQSVGFDDYNYFTKVFKKGTGMTPRQYRASHT